LCVAALLGTGWQAATVSARHLSATSVLIGFAGPLSGDGASVGRDYLNGVQMAVDEVNAAGGVLGGRKLSIISQDDQADPQQATNVAQRLVDGHVVAVIGHLTSGTTIPTIPIYSRAHIPELTPGSNPKVTSGGYSNVFRVDTDDSVQGGGLGSYVVRTMHLHRLAVIDDKQAFGQGVAMDFAAGVTHAGGQVTSINGINPGDVDYRAIITKVKSEHPDGVYFGGVQAQGGLLIQQMRSLGMTVPFFGPDGLYGPQFIKTAGKAAEGTYVTFEAPPPSSNPDFTAFATRYQARFKVKPSVAQYGYDSVELIVQAIKSAGSADPSALVSALHAGTFKGVLGTYKFNKAGALEHGGTIYLYKVHQGVDVYVTAVSGTEA
jgi:branched-chain amino acid transport system substrate-binding protein